MLKTNSKKAIENIQNYIMDNFTPEGYTAAPPKGWHSIATFIFKTFKNEKYNSLEDFHYFQNYEFGAFADWCAGLAGVLDTRYYCNRSAVDDLEAILEETAEEKARYSEEEAEKMLTWLIYRTITKEVK